jgi:hypothetical protein
VASLTVDIASNMFGECKALWGLSSYNMVSLTMDIASKMFGECKALWGLSSYNVASLTVDIASKMFGECKALCTLKTSFADFRKVYVHCSHHKRQFFLTIPNSPYFIQRQLKVVDQVDPTLPSLLYILLNLFSS